MFSVDYSTNIHCRGVANYSFHFYSVNLKNKIVSCITNKMGLFRNNRELQFGTTSKL